MIFQQLLTLFFQQGPAIVHATTGLSAPARAAETGPSEKTFASDTQSEWLSTGTSSFHQKATAPSLPTAPQNTSLGKHQTARTSEARVLKISLYTGAPSHNLVSLMDKIQDLDTHSGSFRRYHHPKTALLFEEVLQDLVWDYGPAEFPNLPPLIEDPGYRPPLAPLPVKMVPRPGHPTKQYPFPSIFFPNLDLFF